MLGSDYRLATTKSRELTTTTDTTPVITCKAFPARSPHWEVVLTCEVLLRLAAIAVPEVGLMNIAIMETKTFL